MTHNSDEIGGGATGTIRPSTSPRMPTSGFEGGHPNIHHSEWSWDAPEGSMDGSCRRALELGISAIAFAEA
jgi:hypothetical protein